MIRSKQLYLCVCVCMCLSHQPVALAIVHPLGGPQSYEGRAPVVETGITVETVKQIGGGTDHPARQRVTEQYI